MSNKHIFFGMQKLLVVSALRKQSLTRLRIINFLTRHEKLTKLLIPIRFPRRSDKIGIPEIITMMRNIAAASRKSLADVYAEIFTIMFTRMVRDASTKYTIPD